MKVVAEFNLKTHYYDVISEIIKSKFHTKNKELLFKTTFFGGILSWH